MNEVIQALKERRSCRSYKPDPIPTEILDQILEAGTYAPTGMGRQSPIMIAVTDRETRDRLSRMNAAARTMIPSTEHRWSLWSWQTAASAQPYTTEAL